MPKAWATGAIRRPSRPKPSRPRVEPSRSPPIVLCQPPSRIAASSVGILRSSARISPQVSSAVGATLIPVPQTTTPLRRAAATSIATLASPVVISSLSSGRRSRIGAGLLERDDLPLLRDAVPAAVVEGDALVIVEQDDPLHTPSLTHG